jgi:prepilin-type N-terminal cleavage/methylation domain-containing protein
VKKRGVTLIELIVVLAIMGIVLSTTYFIFTSTNKFYNKTDNNAYLQDLSRQVMGRMEKDIRLANFMSASFTTSSYSITYLNHAAQSTIIIPSIDDANGTNPITPLVYFEDDADIPFMYVLVNFTGDKELRKYNINNLSDGDLSNDFISIGKNINSIVVQDISISTTSKKAISIKLDAFYKGETKSYSTTVSLRNGG